MLEAYPTLNQQARTSWSHASAASVGQLNLSGKSIRHFGSLLVAACNITQVSVDSELLYDTNPSTFE